MAKESHTLTHEQRRRLTDFIAPFRVQPGKKVTLTVRRGSSTQKVDVTLGTTS